MEADCGPTRPAAGAERRRIAAVVLNYRTPEITLGAVRSLAADLDPAADAIVVVDNHSADGAWESLCAELEAARGDVALQVVVAPRNGGFAYGTNLGMAAVAAEAYLLLNSDARLAPGAAAALGDVLARRPEAGIVGPLVRAEDGTPLVSAFRDRTPWNELLRAARSRLLSRLLAPFGVQDVPIAPGGPSRPVDWVSFVCVLLRGEMVRAVGPLDEGYFMYLEDNDYCRAARARGWTSWYHPPAVVVHLNRGWSGRPQERAPACLYASRARYFRKFHPRGGLFAANICFTAGWGLSWLGERLTGRRRPATARAVRDIWGGPERPLSGCSPGS